MTCNLQKFCRVLFFLLFYCFYVAIPSYADINVCILYDKIEGLDLEYINTLRADLKKANFELAYVDCNQLADSNLFNSDHFDCLILTDSAKFPSVARISLDKFLNGGGDIITLKGHAFSKPLLKNEAEWKTTESIPQSQGKEQDIELFEKEQSLETKYFFDDYEVYDLQDIVTVHHYSENNIFLDSKITVEGDFTGKSSIGFSFPGKSNFFPILEARDKYDRRKGWAAGATINYSGKYKNSHWAYFGINEPEFYNNKKVTALIIDIINKFNDPKLINQIKQNIECENKYNKTLSCSNDIPLITIKNGHFYYPDGRRFFIIGVNFFNSFDRYYAIEYPEEWDEELLEEDFRRMKRAGINTVRIHGFHRFATKQSTDRLNVFLGLAKKYAIYVLPVIISHTAAFPEKSGIEKEVARIVDLVRQENIILGYDLQNEPYFWELAEIKINNTTLGDIYDFEKLVNYFRGYAKWANLDLNDFTFYNLKDVLPKPIDPNHKKGFDMVDNIYRDWIQWYLDVIAKYDKIHPVTIGYNTLYSCMPANKKLDFVSQHVYRLADCHDNVIANYTTLDRMKKHWPDKPVILSEFGYSNGDLIKGEYLDFYNSSVGEAIFYLYSLSNNHDGVMKWQLCDWSMPNIRKRAIWWTNEDDLIRQGRFGMYYADGTIEGGSKPIVYFTRFLSDYVEEGNLGGSIEIKKSSIPIETTYVYKNTNALFVGDIKYSSPELSFVSENPANVMIYWTGTTLKLMSTCDIKLEIKPERFVPSIKINSLLINGKYASKNVKSQHLQLELLEGKLIEIRNK